jgi:hypothetical protein
MHDGIEVVEAAALEGQFGQTGAVETAIGGDDFRTKGADNLTIDGLAGLHHLAAERVGLNDVGAELA